MLHKMHVRGFKLITKEHIFCGGTQPCKQFGFNLPRF